jgi:hypothetical protein
MHAVPYLRTRHDPQRNSVISFTLRRPSKGSQALCLPRDVGQTLMRRHVRMRGRCRHGNSGGLQTRTMVSAQAQPIPRRLSAHERRFLALCLRLHHVLAKMASKQARQKGLPEGAALWPNCRLASHGHVRHHRPMFHWDGFLLHLWIPIAACTGAARAYACRDLTRGRCLLLVMIIKNHESKHLQSRHQAREHNLAVSCGARFSVTAFTPGWVFQACEMHPFVEAEFVKNSAVTGLASASTSPG